MKNDIVDGVGSGCAAALLISAIALAGSSTLLGMSLLIPNNHMSEEMEDAAPRVASTSLVVGGLSLLGLTIAGTKLEEERLYKLLEEKQSQIYAAERRIRELEFWKEINQDTVSKKEYRNAIEARDTEIFRRGKTIRELRIQLTETQKQLNGWAAWWSGVRHVGLEYDVAGCRGCKHYEGSNHQGNFLACGMHPYGKKQCSDWESQS